MFGRFGRLRNGITFLNLETNVNWVTDVRSDVKLIILMIDLRES